ncbi:MAG: alpha/beta fold hydrolase [Alphaproteobacteria bacterium]|nr:alpha/beta fold hydrolase [Alphaproteobacteria bacterium]
MSHQHHITRPDGTRIAYSVTGANQGTPLILSNSLATDARMWEKVLPALQAQFRVITYDTRGHGESSCTSGSPSLSDLSQDLIAVLDAAGASKALLAGVSLGGMTGMTLALEQPERLLGLMACNCRARINAEGIAGWDQRVQLFSTQGIEALVPATLERWFAPDVRTGDTVLMTRMADIIRTTTLAGYVSCVNAIKGMAMHDQLHRIQLPVLYLAGAQDDGAPVSEMQAMSTEVKGSRCEVLDPCGHISPMQRPDDFVRLLQDFATRAA